MCMTIAAQRLAHDADRRRVRVAEQSGEVLGGLARHSLSDDLRGGRTYPGQGLQIALLHETDKLATRQPANNLGSTPKSADAVRRSPRTLQLEGDLPQRARGVHRANSAAQQPGAVRSPCDGHTARRAAIRRAARRRAWQLPA